MASKKRSCNDISTLKPGDGVLTRRVKQRCKEIGFVVEEVRQWNGYGYETCEYHVPTTILREELARRQHEREAARLKEERRRAKQHEIAVCDLLEEFPRLSRADIETVGVHRVLPPDKIGYQFGYGTKSYWQKLGYRVTGEPSRYVPNGNRLIPVFGRMSLLERRSRTTVAARWSELCDRLGNQVALATALRWANRLQKVRKIAGFYSLKDEWIRRNQQHLIEGRIARREVRECWCYGDHEECWKCGGTGVYSSRTLYEHIFDIEGERFEFHSYQEPRCVSETPGSNEKIYGRKFRPEELPLPPQSQLIEMVRLGLNDCSSGE